MADDYSLLKAAQAIQKGGTDTRPKNNTNGASLVTSDGTTTTVAPTNSDGTQSNAVNEALNSNKTRNRMEFNPGFETRIQGAKDRQAMRGEAKKEIADKKVGTKEYKLQKRLDKKVLRKTGKDLNLIRNKSIYQLMQEERASRIAKNLDNIKPSEEFLKQNPGYGESIEQRFNRINKIQ